MANRGSCAACKHHRRRCGNNCPAALYFPADEPNRFRNVQKVFGYNRFMKWVEAIPPNKREDAVKSLVYEANMRIRSPVHGCMGYIETLEWNIKELEAELHQVRVTKVGIVNDLLHQTQRVEAELDEVMATLSLFRDGGQ